MLPTFLADTYPISNALSLPYALDVLRECRSVNSRLINYICRHDIIMELVSTTFEVPPIASPARPNGTGSATTATSAESHSPPYHEQEKERNLKYAHIASELLTSDNKRISYVIVSDEVVMDKIFSYLRDTPPGQLHNLVAAYFSKLIVSLLKIHNAPTIQQLSRYDPPFIDVLLTHVDSTPIADLIVRILDAPDPDLTGNHHTNKLPSQEAIEFLISAKLLNGLADCFVRASSESLHAPLADSKETSSEDDHSESDAAQELRARLRRLREETMSNVTVTVLALNERILQFPELDLAVPDPISPYASPDIASRLLDAGLYASCNPPSMAADGSKRATPNLGETHAERVEAFSTGNNSALLHSLGLAADLMTADCNIFRDDNDDDIAVPVDFNSAASATPTFAGNGIGPSVMAAAGSQSEGGSDDASTGNGPSSEGESGVSSEEAPKDKSVPGPLQGKKAGDPIVSTEKLCAELSKRFSRLSEMFGEVDDIASAPSRRPLGSLRLKLAEFFAACMKSGSQEAVDQIMDLGVPRKLLELFGRYQWSSMLHGVITDSIVSSLSFEEACRPARVAWVESGLIRWLIDSWAKNDDSSPPGSRAGFMGHLIRIGTALKSFLEEGQDELDPGELPPKQSIAEFYTFSAQVLIPAHMRETTPICDGDPSGSGEGDEGEDATDVLDMAGIQAGIQFVENISNREASQNASKYNVASRKDEDIDDEGEIQPVETFEDDIINPVDVDVDDLDHFGSDTPRAGKRSLSSVDHDIPADLREKMSEPEVIAVKPLEEDPSNEADEKVVISDKTEKVEVLEKMGQPSVSDDLSGVIDNVDSSSEDEGNYINFMDEQREAGNAKLEADMARMGITEGGPSASLDEVVTEIEEPAPITNIVDDDSSDDEYVAWEDTSRVRPGPVGAVQVQAVGGSSDDKGMDSRPDKVA